MGVLEQINEALFWFQIVSFLNCYYMVQKNMKQGKVSHL